MSAGVPLNVHPALAGVLNALSGDAQRAATDPKVATYHLLLAAHDWHYEHSDDQRVWRAGCRERAELMLLQAELDPMKAIWNRFAPEVQA